MGVQSKYPTDRNERQAHEHTLHPGPRSGKAKLSSSVVHQIELHVTSCGGRMQQITLNSLLRGKHAVVKCSLRSLNNITAFPLRRKQMENIEVQATDLKYLHIVFINASITDYKET